MTNDEIDELRQRMGESVLLPHGDPRRQALVDELSRLDEGFRQEWLDLVREDELLRIELARVRTPPGLQERLLSIAADAPRIQPPSRRPRLLSRGAAALLVAGLIAWMMLTVNARRAAAKSLGDIALVTMTCHESDTDGGLVTSDWSALESSVRHLVRYRVDRPTLDGSFELLGGRAIAVAGTTMIHSRWRRGDVIYSLYQFCAKDFSLKDPIPWQQIQPLETDRARCAVILWTEAHCSYAMVFPRGAEPPPLPPGD